jgi:hypothetical protein
MIFPMPHYPCFVEIPNDWLAEAGLIDFTPTPEAYVTTPGARLIPLTQIEPVPRYASRPNDHHGFDRSRLIHLLKRFVAGEVVDPVPAAELPIHEFCLITLSFSRARRLPSFLRVNRCGLFSPAGRSLGAAFRARLKLIPRNVVHAHRLLLLPRRHSSAISLISLRSFIRAFSGPIFLRPPARIEFLQQRVSG